MPDNLSLTGRGLLLWHRCNHGRTGERTPDRAGRIGMSKVGWPTARRARRLAWTCGVSLTVVAVGLVIFRPASHTPAPAPAPTPHPSTVRDSPARSASSAAVTWPVAGPVADLSEPLPGMPPVPD